MKIPSRSHHFLRKSDARCGMCDVKIISVQLRAFSASVVKMINNSLLCYHYLKFTTETQKPQRITEISIQCISMYINVSQ
jgi:hypothetical protein